jgi:hypothetical protein
MSIHEIFKSESLNNPNHHIYCNKLDTSEFSTATFNANTITSDYSTVNVQSTSNNYIKSDAKRLIEVSGYAIERMNTVIYNLPLSASPLVYINNAKGGISGLEGAFMETGRMYELDYTVFFSPSVNNTVSFFTFTLGNTTTLTVSNSSTTQPNIFSLKLNFTVILGGESGVSLSYVIKLTNELTGAITYTFAQTFNTVISNYFMPITINYAWNGSTIPLGATRLSYVWRRIA